MHAFTKEVDEELHVGVGVALVVTHAVVVTVLRELFDRLKSCRAEVFHEDEAHVLRTLEGDLDGDLVADLQSAFADRNEELALVGDGLHEQLAADLEARLVALDFVDGHEILTEQAAPDEMSGGVVNGEAIGAV